MNNCNSLFTNYIIKNSKIISNFFAYFNTSQYDIISLGVFCTGVALIYLIEDNFYMFLLFLILGHLTNILNVLYVKDYPDKKKKYAYNYNNISNWFKIFLLILFYHDKYENKISNEIILIFTGILIFCNVNYTIKNCLKLKKGKKLDYFTEIWTAPICLKSKDKLEKICILTKYFDENLSFIYILIGLIYIHHK